MVCAVTGAAGHIGTNLVRELLAQGRDTRIIDLREPAALVALGADFVTADVRDPVPMAAALSGVDTVFHLAAVISVTGSRGGAVEDVNVNGVRTVAEAALRAGVRRLVHCSSVHAFDLEALRGRPVDEQAPRSLARRLPAYDRSKAAGEVQLRRVVEQGLDAVVVNPTGVIGPRDEQPSRMGHFFLALAAGRLPATVEGGFDWVDVRDVVTALLAAETRGRTGENYLVGGHYATTRELAEVAHAVTGRGRSTGRGAVVVRPAVVPRRHARVADSRAPPALHQRQPSRPGQHAQGRLVQGATRARSPPEVHPEHRHRPVRVVRAVRPPP